MLNTELFTLGMNKLGISSKGNVHLYDITYKACTEKNRESSIREVKKERGMTRWHKAVYFSYTTVQILTVPIVAHQILTDREPCLSLTVSYAIHVIRNVLLTVTQQNLFNIIMELRALIQC